VGAINSLENPGAAPEKSAILLRKINMSGIEETCMGRQPVLHHTKKVTDLKGTYLAANQLS